MNLFLQEICVELFTLKLIIEILDLYLKANV